MSSVTALESGRRALGDSPVRDVLAIGDTVKITLKIKDDGSYTGSPSRGNPFTGQLSLNGGQV